MSSPRTLFVVGVDLAGPANIRDTSVAWFDERNDALSLLGAVEGADDPALVELVQGLTARGDVVVGLDAPLSYNPGGGDRPGDRRLRRAAREAGLPPGSVMTPTMTRMAFLTLRGIAVARALEMVGPQRPRIVEVHPTAALALRGAAIADAREFKKSSLARTRIVGWLERQGLQGVTDQAAFPDHFVAACAGALAAWKWARGEPVWIEPATPPLHPYDFAC